MKKQKYILDNQTRKIINNRIRFIKKNILFPIKEKYDSVIPLNLYTCWHTKELPPLMKLHYEILKFKNPEFNHYIFDENDCRNFIKYNFDISVLKAFDSLIPCSYKSDLWRFCVLYINGGIYFDIKYGCVNKFKFIALTKREHFVRDIQESGGGTYTALIVALPKNNILLQCINKIVENVNNKNYGNSALEPTGPGLLGSMFSLDDKNNFLLYHECLNLSPNYTSYHIVFLDRIILSVYPQYRDEQNKFQKKEHYSLLWNKRQIYK